MKRIWRPWNEWECFYAGLFSAIDPGGRNAEEAKAEYAKFLRDLPRFGSAIERVFQEWPLSCEHFLSNESLNRIAWIGQAAMCIETGVPAAFRGGFKLLTSAEQGAANATADAYLRRWIRENGNRTASGPVCEDMAQPWLPFGDSR